jgi:hypothetical protein
MLAVAVGPVIKAALALEAPAEEDEETEWAVGGLIELLLGLLVRLIRVVAVAPGAAVVLLVMLGVLELLLLDIKFKGGVV